MPYLKFNSIFNSILILVFSFCFSLTSYADMADTINKAGEQRMLTQKISKEVLLIAKSINAEENQANLKATAELFDTTLNDLFNGAEFSTAKQLNVVKGLWTPFYDNVKVVLGGDISETVLQNIAQQNVPLLKEMNKAVGMFENDSIEQHIIGLNNLSVEMAETINKAGKQRMLSQKMTKELLLIANGIDADANKENLAKTVATFSEALDSLVKANQNANIATQLETVNKIWVDYKPILDAVDTSDAGLQKVAAVNLPLLKEMNKAVQMYANSDK